MNSLNDIIAYTCYTFQNNSIYPLANARLTKLIYLIDWIGTLNTGHQITQIKWEFYHYGPYVDDVINEVAMDAAKFKINHELNSYGSDRKIVQFVGSISRISLSDDVKKLINNIIDITKDLSFSDFVGFVYKSYPVTTTERYHYLNLEVLANECRNKGLKF